MDKLSERLGAKLCQVVDGDDCICGICECYMICVASHLCSQKHYRQLWAMLPESLSPASCAEVVCEPRWMQTFEGSDASVTFNHLTGEFCVQERMRSQAEPDRCFESVVTTFDESRHSYGRSWLLRARPFSDSVVCDDTGLLFKIVCNSYIERLFVKKILKEIYRRCYDLVVEVSDIPVQATRSCATISSCINTDFCIVCSNERAAYMFLPCGHVCICASCVEHRLQTPWNCPLCHVSSSRIIQAVF